jgi:DNA polymerase V
VIGIVDADKFYASCFRAFDPKLIGRPVIVLSNNDGNVIARSKEAKALGILMGAAFFEVRGLCAAFDMAVFSSNHSFFGEMSARFQRLLYDFSSLVEHYSIDEAWLHLEGRDITKQCRELHRRVRALSGVPVSIGVGPTKTLAKGALFHAKHSDKARGVVDLSSGKFVDVALDRLPVDEVWGIGPAKAEFLQRYNINNALALRGADDRWIRQHLTVTGLRTVHELRGTVCYPLCTARPVRKMVNCSRAFGAPVETLADVRAAVASFVSIAAAKLRREGLVCGRLAVSINADGFRDDLPQYHNSAAFSVAPLSNCTLELSHLALTGLSRIFRPGYAYRRAGVSLDALVPESGAPAPLFVDKRCEGLRRIMQAVDYCNARFGTGVVKVGLFPSSALWRTKATQPAPGYTVNWSDVVVAH